MKRTAARKLALEVLYEADVTGSDGIEILRRSGDKGSVGFAEELVSGVSAHISEIDEVITKYAMQWSIERMPVIDRNILRMGVFEILYLEEVPDAVSINEAVELAKSYSTADSGKFINGILSHVATG